MCSICKDVLKNFGIAHTEERCPLRTSLYCSNCATYGHRLQTCPDKPSILFTEPAYVEQLLPPSYLSEFKITTRTPIQGPREEEPPRLLEIQDNDKVIAEYLSARSVKSRKGATKRQTLEEYAKLQNKRVVYVK